MMPMKWTPDLITDYVKIYQRYQKEGLNTDYIEKSIRWILFETSQSISEIDFVMKHLLYDKALPEYIQQGINSILI